MALATNIVIADGQATPVNHTLVPTGRDRDGVLRYLESTTGPVLGAWQAGISLKKPAPAKALQNTSNRLETVKVSIRIPTLETMANNSAGYTPAPMVSHYREIVADFKRNERASEIENKTARLAIIGLLQSADFINAWDKGILNQ